MCTTTPTARRLPRRPSAAWPRWRRSGGCRARPRVPRWSTGGPRNPSGSRRAAPPRVGPARAHERPPGPSTPARSPGESVNGDGGPRGPPAVLPGASRLPHGRAERGVHAPLQLHLRHVADDPLHQLPALEDAKRGNAHDAELHRQVLVVVHINLGDFQLPLVLPGEVFDDGRDQAARATPLGPEVHQDRGLRLHDLLIERLLGYVHRLGHANTILLDVREIPSHYTR